MTQTESGGPAPFRLPRDLTLPVVGAVRRDALAMGTGAAGGVDAGGVEVVDFAGLQLILAIQRSGRAGPEPCSASVVAAMERAGFSLPTTN